MHDATATIYDRIAGRWLETRGEANDDLGQRIRDEVGDGLVADLGCGPGRYLTQIAGAVIGVDVSAAMLTLAGRHGYPVVQADLESLPFADGALAGAFARHSYLHVPKARVTGALAELRRAMRPGGVVVLTLIEGEYEGEDLPGDDFPGRYFAFWTVADLSSALTSAGFDNIRVDRTQTRAGTGDLLATVRR
jgi:SAM-dependent methyltransferase